MKKILYTALPVLALAIIIFFNFFYQPRLESKQYTGFYMGSVVSVTSYAKKEVDAQLAGAGIKDAVGNLDLRITKNSEGIGLYPINQMSGFENEIDSETFGYIKETADIYSKSEGKLSVTSGALTELWGIDTDEFRLPSQAEIDAALPLCDDSLITLDSEKLTVKTAKGQIINLGSVGKGIACDRAFDYFNTYDGDWSGAVVSVGGSVGIFGTKNRDYSWTVGIRDPYGNENEYFAVLNLKKAVGENGIFISTSGSYEKTFEADGKTYHHILDLTTGYPVETELVSVTVKADTGLLSDALSTLCFVLGEEKSQSILDSYGASAVYVYADKTVSAYGELSDALEIVNADYKLR